MEHPYVLDYNIITISIDTEPSCPRHLTLNRTASSWRHQSHTVLERSGSRNLSPHGDGRWTSETVPPLVSVPNCSVHKCFIWCSMLACSNIDVNNTTVSGNSFLLAKWRVCCLMAWLAGNSGRLNQLLSMKTIYIYIYIYIYIIMICVTDNTWKHVSQSLDAAKSNPILPFVINMYWQLWCGRACWVVMWHEYLNV